MINLESQNTPSTMIQTELKPDPRTPSQSFKDKVKTVLTQVPLLWPLKNFVAVNPFLGLRGFSFLKAAQWVRKITHSDIFMSPEYYLTELHWDNISDREFLDIQTRIGVSDFRDFRGDPLFPDIESLRNYLLNFPQGKIGNRILSFADFFDEEHKTSWKGIITEEISKWSSVYFDQGQSLWPMPWKEENFWEAWRKASLRDRNPEWLGLRDFRKRVESLPHEPLEVIEWVLQEMEIPESHQLDFMARSIMSIPGWASHAQYLSREKSQIGEEDPSLLALLAIRLVFDLALFIQMEAEGSLKSKWFQHLHSIPQEAEMDKEVLALYLAQSLSERNFQKGLIESLKNPAGSVSQEVKTLQAIFCIDVRSELYRRALESRSNEIETLGFAGFFGIALEFFPFGKDKSLDLCPVLIQPRIIVGERLKKGRGVQELKALDVQEWGRIFLQAWNSFKASAISCFSFVESVGIGFIGLLFKQSFPLGFSNGTFSPQASSYIPVFREKDFKEPATPSPRKSGMETGQEIKLAYGALKNMGLIKNFASLVLVCGHGSTSVNNPYASSLDCGACGGHSGEINAKVLVEILNSPEVRRGLKEYEIYIPETTYFIAGLHNTTTDELEIFDNEAVPGQFQKNLNRIKIWLHEASQEARKERELSGGLREYTISKLDREVKRKSQDWSEIRPEWGLSGNAAFIIAPRNRTRNLNLGGRVFLHNYHADQDQDQSILELILLAPTVVATWINLQYYGSTVNNALYGSGNKLIHNVVGKMGVWQGNGGDLQTGLPIQSLYNGKKWMHEPLRLSVFLEAEPRLIQETIQKHQELIELTENEWIYIFSIDPATQAISQLVRGSSWERLG